MSEELWRVMETEYKKNHIVQNSQRIKKNTFITKSQKHI